MMYLVQTIVYGIPDEGRTFFCTNSQKGDLVEDLLDRGWIPRGNGFTSPDENTDVYILEVSSIVTLEYTKELFQ